MTAPVTIVSCVYGDRGFDRFIWEWNRAVKALETRPYEVIVVCDRIYDIPCAHVFVDVCEWEHPQAFFLQEAVRLARTEWVWFVDIDDVPMRDALNGFEQPPAADVWVCGYVTSDGEEYVPVSMTAAEVLASSRNLIPAGSMVRTDAFRGCGGFADVAFQDWALWRTLARRGATFQSTGRPNYMYRRHPAARTRVELRPEFRDRHLAEMETAVAC